MATGNDMRAHETTYSGFLGMVKVGIVVVALLTMLVVSLIAS